MDTTDPDIRFDAAGVSNHWYEYHSTAAKRLLPMAKREIALNRVVNMIKGARGRDKYDCIVGLSGGTDSSYLACLASELGLNPLAVHFDNSWNSEQAVQNIEKVISSCGIDLHTYVMDWQEFRDLQRSYFEASVIDLEIPTDHLIFGALFRIAAKFGIRYILNGNNVVSECILPKAWYFSKWDLHNLKDIHRTHGTIPLRNLPTLGVIAYLWFTKFRGISDVKLLDLVDYQVDPAKEKLRSIGWKDYGLKHFESTFTRFYQGYILPRKWDVDKRKAHYSNLICSNQMTRDEALQRLQQPTYDPRAQAQDKRYVAKKLGYSDDEFEQLLSRPNRSHEEYQTNVEFTKRYFAFMGAVRPLSRTVGRLLPGARSP